MVQTRNDMGEILEYPTLREALLATQEDRTIWKVSFPLGDERVRLVRSDRAVSEAGNVWVFDPIMGFASFLKNE